MSEQDLLTCLLSSMGHSVDLNSFQNGILVRDDDPTNNIGNVFPEISNADNELQHSKKRQRRNGDDEENQRPNRKKRKRKKKRRKIRIGLDVKLWISKALQCHVAAFSDRRGSINCGRTHLFMERHQQQHQEKKGSDTTTTRNIVQQHQEQIFEEMAEAECIQKCTSYVMSRITALRQATNSESLVVFDGNTPPVKCNGTLKRRGQRVVAADSLIEEKECDYESQEEAITRTIKAAKKASTPQISSSTLHSLVISSILSSLRSLEIPFLVSPYESNGQLAFLASKNYIDVVITDDSDLLGYGYVDNIIFKVCKVEEDEEKEDEINNESQNLHERKKHCIPHKGILLQKSDLGGGRSYSSHGSLLHFMDFSKAMMATTFVASGCDYCTSSRGIGILTARNIVKEIFHSVSGVLADDYINRGVGESHGCSVASPVTPSTATRRHVTATEKGSDQKQASLINNHDGDIVPPLPRVLTQLFKINEGNTITQEQKQEYEEQFLKALISFRHCIVYDPKTCSCIFSNFNDSIEDEDDWLLKLYPPYAKLCQEKKTLENIVGRLYDKEEATYIAKGWLNPRTGQLFQWRDVTENHIPSSVLRWWENKDGKRKRGEKEDEEEEARKDGDHVLVLTSAAAMSALSETQGRTPATFTSEDVSATAKEGTENQIQKTEKSKPSSYTQLQTLGDEDTATTQEEQRRRQEEVSNATNQISLQVSFSSLGTSSHLLMQLSTNQSCNLSANIQSPNFSPPPCLSHEADEGGSRSEPMLSSTLPPSHRGECEGGMDNVTQHSSFSNGASFDDSALSFNPSDCLISKSKRTSPNMGLESGSDGEPSIRKRVPEKKLSQRRRYKKMPGALARMKYAQYLDYESSVDSNPPQSSDEEVSTRAIRRSSTRSGSSSPQQIGKRRPITRSMDRRTRSHSVPRYKETDDIMSSSDASHQETSNGTGDVVQAKKSRKSRKKQKVTDRAETKNEHLPTIARWPPNSVPPQKIRKVATSIMVKLADLDIDNLFTIPVVEAVPQYGRNLLETC